MATELGREVEEAGRDCRGGGGGDEGPLPGAAPPGAPPGWRPLLTWRCGQGQARALLLSLLVPRWPRV